MRFSPVFVVAIVSGVSLAGAVRTIHQFPKPTWVENVASTRNGSLLVGILGQPPAQLHILDPFTNTTQDTLLHTFAPSNSIFGIAEYETDVFAVAAGNFSSTTYNGTGDANIWTVDLRRGTTKDSIKVRKLAHLPDAQINGIAALNSETLLFADSWAGNIRKLDIKTGKHEIVLQDATTANNVSTPLPLGANGLKILRSNTVPSSKDTPTLYFSNLQLGKMFRVPIDGRTGKPRGCVVTIVSDLGVIDDLAVTDDGTVFLARDIVNDVVRISGEGEVVELGGGNATIFGPTAATLGRTYRDRGVLYVSGMGGYAADGSFLEGGSVVAIDLGA